MKFFRASLAAAIIAGLSVSSGAEIIRGRERERGRERDGRIREILGDKGRLRGPSRKLLAEPVKELYGVTLFEGGAREKSLLDILESLLEDIDTSLPDLVPDLPTESRRLRRFRDDGEDAVVETDEESRRIRDVFEDILSKIDDVDALNRIKERLTDVSTSIVDLDVFEQLQDKLGNITKKLENLVDVDISKLTDLGITEELKKILDFLQSKLSLDLNLKDSAIVTKTKELIDGMLKLPIFDFKFKDIKLRKLRIRDSTEESVDELKEEITNMFDSLLDFNVEGKSIFDELEIIDKVLPSEDEKGILSRAREGLPQFDIKDRLDVDIFGGKGLDGIPTFFKGDEDSNESRRLLMNNMFDGDRTVFDGDRVLFDGDRHIFEGDGRIFDGDRLVLDGDRKFFDGDRRIFDGDMKVFDDDRDFFPIGSNGRFLDRDRSLFDRDDRDRPLFDRDDRDRPLFDRNDRDRPIFDRNDRDRPIFDRNDRDRPIFDKDDRDRPIFDKEDRDRPIFDRDGRDGNDRRRDRSGDRDGIISKIVGRDRRLVSIQEPLQYIRDRDDTWHSLIASEEEPILSKIRDREGARNKMSEIRNGDLLSRIRGGGNGIDSVKDKIARKLSEEGKDRTKALKGGRSDKLGKIIDGIKERGDRDSERKRGDRDSERKRGESDSERKRGDSDSERKRGDSDSERKRGDRDSERKRGDRDSDRKKERDSERSRKLLGASNLKGTLTTLDEAPKLLIFRNGRITDGIVGEKAGKIGDILDNRRRSQ